MSNKRSNRIHKILLGQFLVSALILFIAAVLIFYSQGFRINFKNFKIIKTSVLTLTVSPKPDKIFINGNEYEGKTYIASNIPAGNYDIMVKKSGYYDWKMSLDADAERLYNIENIKLFLSSPVIEELSDQDKIDLLNSPDSALAENAESNLSGNSYEIWVDSQLITRFSEPISGVKWYSDMKHILFAKGNSVYVIEPNGINCTELFKLDHSTLGLRFISGNQGREIFFYDNEKYYRVKVR